MAFCAKPRALLAPHFWSLLSDDNPDEDEDEEDDDEDDEDVQDHVDNHCQKISHCLMLVSHF